MIKWIYWRIRSLFDKDICIIRVGGSKERWATRSIWDGKGIDTLDKFRVWRKAPLPRFAAKLYTGPSIIKVHKLKFGGR